MSQVDFKEVFQRKLELGGSSFDLKFEPFPGNPRDLELRALVKRSKDGNLALVELEGRAGETQKTMLFGKVKVGYGAAKGFSDPVMQPENLGFLGFESDRDHLQLMITIGKKESYRFWLDVALRAPEEETAQTPEKPVQTEQKPVGGGERPAAEKAPKKPAEPVAPPRKMVPSYGIANGNYAIPKLFHISADSSGIQVEEGLARFRRMSQTYLTHKSGGNRIPLVLSGLEFRYTPLGRDDIGTAQAKNGQKVVVVRKPNQLWVLYPAERSSELGERQLGQAANQLASLDDTARIKTALELLGRSGTFASESAKYTLAIVDIPEKKKNL